MFKYFNIILGIMIWGLAWNQVLATQIIVEDITVGVGQEVIVPIKLDTEGEVINAISGRVRMSGVGASLFDVNEKNSFISFWLVRPKVTASALEFSGIIPGGFRGVIGPGIDSYDPGVIFNLVIRGKAVGSARLSVDIDNLVKHSESPENINISGETATITVTAEVTDNISANKIEDTTPPEVFEPLVVKSNLISNTGYALVFQSHDSDSGIDHYEVKINDGEFVRAESPYPLEYSQINSIIHIRAIDRAGNVREATAGKDLGDGSQSYMPWIALAVVILVLSIIYILWLRARSLKQQRY